MSRFEEVLAKNKLRRQRLIEGKYNCLPFPFFRFRKVYPGIEQGKFIIITANQKVGKSKLADYLFIYEPLFFMVEHPEANIKVKDIYFSLEMSATEKFNECTNEELINVYDNTIYYTSYIISALIKKAQKYAANYNVVLIYVSDHGESLGENGLYLHSAPYIVAPKEQTRVPFLLWATDETWNALGIDKTCLLYSFVSLLILFISEYIIEYKKIVLQCNEFISEKKKILQSFITKNEELTNEIKKKLLSLK